MGNGTLLNNLGFEYLYLLWIVINTTTKNQFLFYWPIFLLPKVTIEEASMRSPQKRRRLFSKESVRHSISSDQYPGPEAISTSSNQVIARIFESPVETREMLVFCLRQLVDIIRAGFTLSASLGPYILAPFFGAGVGRYVNYLWSLKSCTYFFKLNFHYSIFYAPRPGPSGPMRKSSPGN